MIKPNSTGTSVLDPLNNPPRIDETLQDQLLWRMVKENSDKNNTPSAVKGSLTQTTSTQFTHQEAQSDIPGEIYATVNGFDLPLGVFSLPILGYSKVTRFRLNFDVNNYASIQSGVVVATTTFSVPIYLAVFRRKPDFKMLLNFQLGTWDFSNVSNTSTFNFIYGKNTIDLLDTINDFDRNFTTNGDQLVGSELNKLQNDPSMIYFNISGVTTGLSANELTQFLTATQEGGGSKRFAFGTSLNYYAILANY